MLCVPAGSARAPVPRPGDVEVGDQAAGGGLGRQRSQGGDRAWQCRDVGGRGGHQGHPAAAGVLGGDEPAARTVTGRDVTRGHVRQLVVAVVAAGQHLEQRRVVRARA